MSCSKIQDLQDLAADLFQFDDQQRQKPKRDNQVKKQKKMKKQQIQQKAKEDLSNQEEYIPQISKKFVNFKDQKAPGTHSIFVKTFGCSHNISDSEFMVGQLVDYGYKMVDNAQDADLVLINSCTVVNPSQTAFINMVCKAKKIKKPIVVAGCVPQGQQGIPQLQQVSAVGVTQIDRIVQVVQQTLKGHKVQLMAKKDLPSLDLPKIRKNKDIQIIAINAGCLGSCTYCKTVFARGKLISYTPESIVHRVGSVVKQGVKQLWLTSQDTGAYGRDINTNISQLLISLCQELENHNEVMMRIGMTNPPYMHQHLRTIAHFLNHPRVYSFVHIPVQAGHNTVLQKMNREYTIQQFTTICDYFIEHCPEVTIATDIICGFAQETDEQFQASLKLIEKYKFRVVNINQFYLRPGTPAANLKQVPSHIVKSRSSKLTKLFKSYDKHSYLKDRQERVWVNEKQEFKGQQYLVGHTKNYTKVIIPYEEDLLYKQIIIKVTKCFDWHVQGQIINRNAQPVKIPQNYLKKMKQDLQQQKIDIQKNKQAKILRMKQKKNQIMKKIETQKKMVNDKNDMDDKMINDKEYKDDKNKKLLKSQTLSQNIDKIDESKLNQSLKSSKLQQKTQATILKSINVTEKEKANNKIQHKVITQNNTQRKLSKPKYQYLVIFIVLLLIGGGMHYMGY